MNNENNTDMSAWVGQFLARVYSRSSLIYLAVGLLVIVAIVLGGHEIEQHITAVEAWITQLGPLGVLAFIGLFVLAATIMVPDTVLCIIAGALFGLLWGAVAVIAGSLLAATIQFALAHKLVRARIHRALAARPSLAAIQRAVSRDEFRLQLLLRLMPLNPATVNYLLGAAGVRFSGFLLASLAHTPNLLIEIYFGYASRHAVRFAGGTAGIAHLHNLVIFGGLAVCLVVMILVSKMARKALMQAVAETESRDAETAGKEWR